MLKCYSISLCLSYMYILASVHVRGQLCTNGFPSRLRSRLGRRSNSGMPWQLDEQRTILIPEMNFSCNGTIVNVTVIGRWLEPRSMDPNRYPRLQIWREGISEEGVYHKITNREIVLNPRRRNCTRLLGDDVSGAVICNGTLPMNRYVSINSGDIVGLQLPTNMSTTFEVLYRNSTLTNFVYFGSITDRRTLNLSNVSEKLQPLISLDIIPEESMSTSPPDTEYSGSFIEPTTSPGSSKVIDSSIASVLTVLLLIIIIILMTVIIFIVLYVKRRKSKKTHVTSCDNAVLILNPMSYDKQSAVPPTPLVTATVTIEGSTVASFPPVSANLTADYDEVAIEPCNYMESSNSHNVMTTDVKSSDNITDESDGRLDNNGSSDNYFILTQNMEQHTADETSDDDTYWEPADTINELYKQMSSNKYREIAADEVNGDNRTSKDAVACVASSKYGELFSTGVNKTVKVYNYKETLSRSPSRIISPSLIVRSDGRIKSIEFGKVDQSLAYGDNVGNVCVIDTAHGCQKYTKINHDAGVSSLAYTRCGRLLVSGGEDSKVNIWCSRDMHRIFSFDTDGRICSVCTHPQHPHLLAYATRDAIHYLDMRNARSNLRSLCVQMDLKSASFVSNTELVVVSSDGQLKLCDIESLNSCVRSFDDPLDSQHYSVIHVHNDLIVCGSWSNILYTFLKDWSVPQTHYIIHPRTPSQCNEGLTPEIVDFLASVNDWNPGKPQPIELITNVCWVKERHCFATLSTGYIIIFEIDVTQNE